MVFQDGFPRFRHASFAGSWYPLDTTELEVFISKSLQEARNREKQAGNEYPQGRFAILPHAGLAFSQRGIAPFFLHFPPQAERILILAPSHYLALNSDELTLGSFTGYETPLGNLGAFSLLSGQQGGEKAIENEHAVEMVLPYLAWIAKQGQKLSVCTALVSHLTGSNRAREIALALIDELGEAELRSGKTLVIASSDFTHYGRRFGHTPFTGDSLHTIEGKVKNDDSVLSSLLASCNVDQAMDFCKKHQSTVCGIAAGSIVASLAAELKATGKLVDYYTSNEVYASDEDEFVAYATILWS